MPLEMSLCRIFYGCRIFYKSSKIFSEANHTIKSFQNFFHVIWSSSWPYIRKNSCYCGKYVKNGVFCKKIGLRRIFYGRRIFWGPRKNFFEPYIRSSLPKKNFVSIGSIVLKISMGCTPPENTLFSGGVRLILHLKHIHLSMLIERSAVYQYYKKTYGHRQTVQHYTKRLLS